MASFADEVASYQPVVVTNGVSLAPQVQRPEQALGAPNFVSGLEGFVSLGNGGSITVRFVDNELTGSGNANKDLWIFEIGPAVEDTDVAISQDGATWAAVGRVSGSTRGVDIDSFGFGPSSRFSFVRLTDVRTLDFAADDTAGADIDAVGAISTVLVDTTPPSVVVPADLVAEATRPAGAPVTFVASASDAVDGPLTPACIPASGDAFPLGTTTVTCTATDAAGNTGSADFVVHVVDTTGPVIEEHADVTAEATGPDGALVAYDRPATHDAVDGVGAAQCSPATGSLFALGQSTVTCTATDSHDNPATPSTFAVTVVDSTAPDTAFTDHPLEFAGGNSASFGFTGSDAVSAPDDLTFACDRDGVAVPDCASPAILENLADGSHTFTVRATDGAGNDDPSPASFTWTVDTVAPALTLPADITAEATSAAGAVVGYDAATATDLHPAAPAVACDLASGSTFPLGATTVTCSATDDAGNTATGAFRVTVIDTTAPVIASIAGDMTLDATGPAGAVATWTAPTASDAVDGVVAVACNPPSGATFVLGATTVTCSATDSAGNTASAAFVVTVVAPAYVVCPLFDQSKAVKSGAVKPIKVQLCDAAGANLSAPGLILHVVGLQRVDGTASAQVEDPGRSNSPDGDFRYDGGSYIFNLDTSGLSTGTWELQFTVTGDTRVYSVRFDVR